MSAPIGIGVKISAGGDVRLNAAPKPAKKPTDETALDERRGDSSPTFSLYT
jgi:hypothetical protein